MAAKSRLPHLVLVVECASSTDELGISTLAGSYVEVGVNHGRKVFRRKEADQACFLYFWDDRDGDNFSGWWFGEKVGGAQVWSRCESDDALPPEAGWRIPWDGDINADLRVRRARHEATGVKEEAAAQEQAQETSDDRIQKALDLVTLAEIEATQALEGAQQLLQGEVSQQGLKSVEAMLISEQVKLLEINKTLAADIVEARKSAPKVARVLATITPRVRTVQASLARELQRLKGLLAEKQQESAEQRRKAAEEKQHAELEQRSLKELRDGLPEAVEALSACEELLAKAEKVSAALLAKSPKDLKQLGSEGENCLQEIEALASEATDGLRKTKALVAQRVVQAKSFAPEARKEALREYSALQERIDEAKRRLLRYLRIRKEHEENASFREVLASVTDRLSSAEEGIEQLQNSLETSTAASFAASSSSARKLKAQLQDIAGQLDTGTSAAETIKMRDRCQASIQRLARLEAQLVLQEALAVTVAAEEAFLTAMAEEAAAEMSLDRCKAASKAAETKTAKAAAFLQAKLADPHLGPDTRAELEQLQDRRLAVHQRLEAFRRDLAERESAELLGSLVRRVEAAEKGLKETSFAAPANGTEEEMKEATMRLLRSETAAAVDLAEAKKELRARQGDPRGKNLPGYDAEIARMSHRLQLVQTGLADRRKALVQGERQWKARLVLQEREQQTKQVEDEIAEAEILTTPIGDETDSAEMLSEMAAAVESAQEHLNLLGSQALGADSELRALVSRSAQCQKRIDEMRASLKERQALFMCSCAIDEVKAQLDAAESSLDDLEAEQGLLLPGDDDSAAFIAAFVAAQRACAASQAVLSTKTLQVRRLPATVAKYGQTQLDALSIQQDLATSRLASARSAAAERRRSVELRHEGPVRKLRAGDVSASRV